MEKLAWVWKGGNLQDVNMMTMQFCTCSVSSEWVHSIDFLSAKCYCFCRIEKNVHKKSTVEKSDLICGNNIWIKSLFNQYLISNQLIL